MEEKHCIKCNKVIKKLGNDHKDNDGLEFEVGLYACVGCYIKVLKKVLKEMENGK